MKIIIIGIILVVVGCSILGWLIKKPTKIIKMKVQKIKFFIYYG